MFSFFENILAPFTPEERFNLLPNELKPRSEGRLKRFESCHDFRAWSLHEDDQHAYLVDVIKLDDDGQSRTNQSGRIDGAIGITADGTRGAGETNLNSNPLTQQQTSTNTNNFPIGDQDCVKKLVQKDKEIEDLRNELGNWKNKYQELSDRTNKISEAKSDPLPVGSSVDKDKEIEDLKAKLASMHDEVAKNQKSSDAKTTDGSAIDVDVIFADYTEYKPIMDETLRGVLQRDTTCKESRNKNKYAEQVKQQLDKMYDLYLKGVNDNQRSDGKDDELHNMAEPLTPDHISKEKEDIIPVEEIDAPHNEPENVITVDEVILSTSAPEINIEVSQKVTLSQVEGHQFSRGECHYYNCRQLNSQNRGYQIIGRNFERTQHNLIVKQQVSADGNPLSTCNKSKGERDLQYVVRGDQPWIELRIPNSNYTMILKPDSWR